MADSLKDKVEGTAQDVKGAVKEKIGKTSNNPDMEADGAVEKLGGKVQREVGDVERAIGD
jgi:uncharacterized protein YjbJ (UPF0337 family)